MVVVDLDEVEAHDVDAHLAPHRAPDRCLGVAGGSPAAVEAAVASGAGLVIIDAHGADPERVCSLARHGVALVLAATDVHEALATVDALGAAGIDTGRVVVELGPVDADPAGAAEAHLGEGFRIDALERLAYGFRVGARLHPVDPDAPERAHGSQIGALTEVLLAGATTVRGVAPARFRRVLAVVRALDAAAAPPAVPR